MAIINWRRVLYTGLQRFQIDVSGVTNAPTLAPSDPFYIVLKSITGEIIASSDSYSDQAELVITNEKAFELGEGSVIIEPQSIELGGKTRYSVVFIPETYIAGMQLELTLPSQIQLSDDDISSFECKSLSSNFAESAICRYDQLDRKVTI